VLKLLGRISFHGYSQGLVPLSASLMGGVEPHLGDLPVGLGPWM
jgi:hypothetical protein